MAQRNKYWQSPLLIKSQPLLHQMTVLSQITSKQEGQIPQQGGFPLPINYSMYLTNGEWKVYDVEIDGISLVINYRTTFANEIRQQGLDKLIAKLSTRNEQAASE